MKINDFVRGIDTWRNNDEQTLLDKIKEPTPIGSFDERDQTIIEGLIRKSLLIKVKGNNDLTYVYPNV